MAEQAENKEPELRAVLIFLSGSQSDEMIKLRRDATIFGRDKGDILIDDTEVSATHCQIQEINNIFHIFDMNSTNGTFVNNQRIIKAKLREGDVITIGQTSFKFSLEDERNVRHIATVFKSLNEEKARNSSLIETLIESELRNTNFNGIKMFVTYSNGKSEEIELRQRLVFVGRASSFGKFDQDSEMSRKHVLIKLNDTGEVFIEDQGSTNGTFLNDKKIKGMHQVGTNDIVQVGETSLRVVAQSL